MTKNYEQIKKRVEAYFLSRLTPKTDKDGKPVLDENGDPVMVSARPMTVTGLTLAIGLTSRDELNTFKSKKTRALIREALMKIEESAEEKLFTKEYFNGAKLFLEVNFNRWRSDGEEDFEGSELLGESGCAEWSQ
ncbi:MAG: hypothetical protein IJV00_04150 [Clostridia bacterium]|nr:hypothetical protein [Clostridia bacterium]